MYAMFHVGNVLARELGRNALSRVPGVSWLQPPGTLGISLPAYSPVFREVLIALILPTSFIPFRPFRNESSFGK